MMDHPGYDEGGVPTEIQDGEASAGGFNGMGMARRVLNSMLGGLEKQAGTLIWKFTQPHLERLWNRLEQKLTAPVIENFKNNINVPEYHSLLTLALSDALKQKEFRDEVERWLSEAKNASPPAPIGHHTSANGNNNTIIIVDGDNKGDINVGDRRREW